MIVIAAVFIITLLIGVPIALVLGLSGMTHMLVMSPDMLIALPQKLFTSAATTACWQSPCSCWPAN